MMGKIALPIEVKTYGFLHIGIEPLRREVLKRTWPYLSGGTLFGAIQAALIRLDGPAGKGPSALLDALCTEEHNEQTLRFMPLLPDNSGTIVDGWSYCRQAQRLAELAHGNARAKIQDPGYQTTPHAPLNRRNAQIHGSMLYAVECHQPEQRYRGWIICNEMLTEHIRRGLAMLPLLPFGGKGKFTCAEATICEKEPPRLTVWKQDFVSAAKKAQQADDIESDTLNVELLSPLVYQAAELGILQKATVWRPKSPRRYRVWRTGVYPNLTSDQGDGRRSYARTLEDEVEALPAIAWPGRGKSGFALGQTSEAVPALPDGSRFEFKLRLHR